MKHVLSILALAASTLAAATSAQAATTNEKAVASGALEVPPNTSPGSSVATFEIDDVAMILRADVPFRDLVAPATMAHIHCCTASAFTGTAPIALPFTAFPTGVTAGSYTHAFDLSDATVFAPTFVGGSTELLRGIAANEAYVNIHTAQYPAGEIRGWLVAAPIPEPSAWAMLGMGLAGLGFMARRRRG